MYLIFYAVLRIPLIVWWHTVWVSKTGNAVSDPINTSLSC